MRTSQSAHESNCEGSERWPRAFRLQKELRNPKQLGPIEVGLFARLRGLTEQGVREAVGESLTDEEVDAVVARAALLVEFFDEKIAELGEVRVLFGEG